MQNNAFTFVFVLLFLSRKVKLSIVRHTQLEPRTRVPTRRGDRKAKSGPMLFVYTTIQK